MLCRSRKFQYGVKYWVCNSLVLCVALIVSEADQPDHLASWHPLFLVATVNVVFSEKVVSFFRGYYPKEILIAD